MSHYLKKTVIFGNRFIINMWNLLPDYILLRLLQLWLALSTDLPNLTLWRSAVLICCLICILGHLLVQFCVLPLCPVDTFAVLLQCYVICAVLCHKYI